MWRLAHIISLGSRRDGRTRAAAGGLAVATLTLILMVATEPLLPIDYWDTFTPGVIDRVNRQTAPGRSIALKAMPPSFHYLKQSGQIRPAAEPLGSSLPWQWYLLQNRPGAMTPLDRALIARHGRRRVLLAKLGVPLVWAFERGEVDAIAAEIRSSVSDPVPADLRDGP